MADITYQIVMQIGVLSQSGSGWSPLRPSDTSPKSNPTNFGAGGQRHREAGYADLGEEVQPDQLE